ncbi:MAG TPA: CHASE2 domain-containing protein [Candidatus Binataceae bacterium]|nr:CHASE2 domain-containing protein [Candidatus Binataceae bacterium]
MPFNLTIPSDWEGIAVILVLVAAWNIFFERWKEYLPFLIDFQLKSYQLMSHLSPRRPRVKWVALVEVDDETFWKPPFSGIQPTNRRALGDLVRKAAAGGATVIALDFQLYSTSDKPGDDPIRADDNQYLLESIRQAVNAGTRVVLTQGFIQTEDGRWKEEPGIFERGALPEGVTFGYINLPTDKREIPLSKTIAPSGGGEPARADSFALQIVDQYEQSINMREKTRSESRIAAAIRDETFVCGSFVVPGSFVRISARDLLNVGPAAELCNGRIVIVGGAWHVSGGRGPLIESFASPVGRIPGMQLHANYVEALLDDRFQPRMSMWTGVVIDLIVGFMIYFLYNHATSSEQNFVLAVPLAMILFAYVTSANLGLYLDFVPPMSLYFVHLAWEHFK